MEISGANVKDFRQIEKSIKGIDIINVARKKSIIESTVEYNHTSDPRAEIFLYAKEFNWIILKMNPTSDNLEDVFRTLTSGEETAHE